MCVSGGGLSHPFTPAPPTPREPKITLGPYISLGVIGAPAVMPHVPASVTPDGALAIENTGFSDSLIPHVHGNHARTQRDT